MRSYSLTDFIHRLRRTRSVAEGGQLTDAELLQRFARNRDEAAFEVLVWRHGALVLNVARRLLRDVTDMEDVFQATFLTLARKASAIRRGTSLGSWLYKVAFRLALQVRRNAARRQLHQPAILEIAESPQAHEDTELAAVLVEEVSRLPERYRAAVVLCYLQGATTEQAARVLGCPRGTVLSRLSTARQRLRRQLMRRGVASVVAATAVTFAEVVSATPSVELVARVVGVALAFAAGRAAIPMVSPHAAALARGALQAMLWNKIKITVAMVCVVALTGTGIGWLTRGQAQGDKSEPAAQKSAKQSAPPATEREREEKRDPEKQLNEVRKQLAMLNDLEEHQEEIRKRDVVRARMHLMELQEEMRVSERELEFELKSMEERLKTLAREMTRLEEQIQDIQSKVPGEDAKQLLKRLMEKGNQNRILVSEQQKEIRQRTREGSKQSQSVRQFLVEAEENLHRLRLRHDQKRDEYLARRRTLQARLERLEEEAMHLPSTDPLREVERKLDALRRDVNELRRARER